MTTNIDITQLIVEKFCSYLNCLPTDVYQKQRMKTDVSQCCQEMITITLFVLWFLYEEDESKYLGEAFFLQVIYFILYYIFILFCQILYIKGEMNDLNIRESWGKTINLLQFSILLYYFATLIFRQGKDSIENTLVLAFSIANMFCAINNQIGSSEAGFSLFLFFCLIGQGIAFYILLLSYYYVIENLDQPPFIFVLGMIGDVLLAIYIFISWCQACSASTISMTNHKMILMMFQGLTLGIGCIYVSILVGLLAFIAILYLIYECWTSNSQVVPINTS